MSVYRLHSDHGELDCDGQESIQSCRVPVELGEGQHFLQKHAPRRVLADVVSHLMPAAVSAGIQGSWTSDVTQLKSAALGTAPALRSGSSRLRWARILASEDRPRAAGRSSSGGRDGHRTMRWTTAHTEHAASSGSCIPATMQAKPVPCEAAHRVIPKEYETRIRMVPRHRGRVRERGPDPHRTDAVGEVLGGKMRHDLDTLEPGGTGLGRHVRDQQSANTYRITAIFELPRPKSEQQDCRARALHRVLGTGGAGDAQAAQRPQEEMLV